MYQKKNNNYYFVGDWGQGHASLPADKVGELLRCVINNQSIEPVNEELQVINSLKLLDKNELQSLFESEIECIKDQESLWDRIIGGFRACFKKR